MKGLSDPGLSDWSCSSHSYFNVYPSNFRSLVKVTSGPGTGIAYMIATDCTRAEAPTPPPPAPPGPDVTAPRVSLQYPGDGDAVTGLEFVTGQASDDRDAPTVTLSLSRESDGELWNGAEWVAPTPAAPAIELSTALSGTSWSRLNSQDQPMPGGALLAPGYYNLRATATDGAGNIARTTARVGVDNAPPQIAITVPSEGATVAALEEVRGSASGDFKLSSARVALQRDSDGAYWAPGVGWVAQAFAGIWQNATFETNSDRWRVSTGWPTGAL